MYMYAWRLRWCAHPSSSFQPHHFACLKRLTRQPFFRQSCPPCRLFPSSASSFLSSGGAVRCSCRLAPTRAPTVSWRAPPTVSRSPPAGDWLSPAASPLDGGPRQAAPGVVRPPGRAALGGREDAHQLQGLPGQARRIPRQEHDTPLVRHRGEGAGAPTREGEADHTQARSTPHPSIHTRSYAPSSAQAG